MIDPAKIAELVNAGALPADKYASYMPAPAATEVPAYLSVPPAAQPSPDQVFQNKVDTEVSNRLNNMSPGQTPQDIAGIRSDAERSLLDKSLKEYQANEATKKSSESLAAQQAQDDLKSKTASIQAENEKRLTLGLTPIPMPAGVTPAVPAMDSVSSSQAATMPGDGSPTPDFSPKIAALKLAGMGLDNAYGMQQAGLAKEAKAQIAKSDETFKVLQDAQAKQDALELERVQKEKVRQDQLAAGFKKYDEVNNSYQAAAAKGIDKDHFWATRSTDQKILAGIGLFLGAFGGVRDGSNPAVKVIENAINQDIETQKANIELKGRAATAQNNVYQSMREKFGDDRAAEAATRLAALNRVDMQLKTTAAKYGGQEIAGKLMQAQGQIEVAKKNAQMALTQAIMSTPEAMGLDRDTAQLVRAAPIIGAKAEDALKEMAEYRHEQDVKRSLLKSFDDVNKYRSVAGTILPGSDSKADAAEAGMIPLLANLYSRFTELEMHTFKENLPKKGDTPDAVAFKRQVLGNLVESKMKPTPILSALKMRPEPIQMGARVRK